MRINNIIEALLEDGHKSKEIALELDVSPALISTWRNANNDFCPRLPIAKKIYKAYNLVTYPFSEKAVSDETL